VAFVAVLPGYTVATFDAAAQEAYVKSITTAARGASTVPTVRVRSVTAASGTASRRLLQNGVAVDTVVVFATADTTAASALYSTLLGNPSILFPTSQVSCRITTWAIFCLSLLGA